MNLPPNGHNSPTPVHFDPLPTPMTAADLAVERNTLTILRTQVRSISEGLPIHYGKLKRELSNVSGLLSNYIAALSEPTAN